MYSVLHVLKNLFKIVLVRRVGRYLRSYLPNELSKLEQYNITRGCLLSASALASRELKVGMTGKALVAFSLLATLLQGMPCMRFDARQAIKAHHVFLHTVLFAPPIVSHSAQL